MHRITVEVTDETMSYLKVIKSQRGSSITFEANSLIEQAIKERNRKKKKDIPLRGDKTEGYT